MDAKDRTEIEQWLRETDEQRLSQLWTAADAVRREHVGDAVHLRGLLEISNWCVRRCAYCGLSADNRQMQRYRMSADEILQCVHEAQAYGYGTVVMQAGEDYGITTEWLAQIVRRIKAETPLAVTLSMGERPHEDLQTWRHAGADRYLLRFETSDRKLYETIHPSRPGQEYDRFDMLRQLKQIGYEVGSGVMVGIPGQTYGTLARDIELFRELDLDMIGVGPYIENPLTPLGKGEIDLGGPELIPKQDASATLKSHTVPNTELMTYKVVALSRIMCPEANIPSTTALATVNRANGRELGLMRGANVVMPNVTPMEYRTKYEIYPGKACLNETANQCQGCLKGRIAAIGRELGTGCGGRRKKSIDAI
ncbi:MAG: [FeFe] hydrogenase H-cluster radical SAM maturase HydE [Planctomycetaceae bacterium]|nr:[FeFe] hydrogenase H-cluster radical SAM maturase HydE [Planctomycetaceae bacterium]